MVSAGDDAKTATGALVDVDEPAGVLLLVNQPVLGLRRADAVKIDLQRTMVVVELDVEEAGGIGVPDHVAARLLDDIGNVVSAFPVADADREIFRSFHVGAPGLELVVGGVLRATEPEVVGLRRQCIAVEQDARVAAAAPRAADHLVLTAFAKLREVFERPVRGRHARIILLDPAAHFGDQFCLQRRRMTEERFGVGVLRLEIGADVGVQHGWVAQHLLPSRILQPGVVVGEGDAVPRKAFRAARCERRFGIDVSRSHIFFAYARLLVQTG